MRVVRDPSEFAWFKPGEILVTTETGPGWEAVMRQAEAIVTDRGGPTSHAVIAARALDKPTIVGTRNGTHVLASGDTVTVWCASGTQGSVFAGRVEYQVEDYHLEVRPDRRTKVLVNVGSPAEAERAADLPCDGIGVTRMEFVVREVVGIHPMALCDFDHVASDVDRRLIKDRIGKGEDPVAFYERALTDAITAIGQSFSPREVIVRLSDLKADEYRGLLGGASFEREENNPMLGFRGAVRYRSDRYRLAFAAECRALARARREMGGATMGILIPFCRTTSEARTVLRDMQAHGLERDAGLTVHLMCEVPSNVILVDEFAELFDGFSIGSNDLTQLALGIDRDSEDLWQEFDERDLAVRRMISTAIRGAKAKGRRVGLCGQAASDYPEFLRFLVHEGIDYVSVNADLDTVIDAIAEIQKAEAGEG